MTSISHMMGSDLDIFEGRLALVSDGDEVTQKLLRRLCTNAGDVLWHRDFGAGLPETIGDPVDVDRVRGLVLAQVVQDPGVDRTQPVTVTVGARSDGRYDCSVVYVAASDGAARTLGFSS